MASQTGTGVMRATLPTATTGPTGDLAAAPVAAAPVADAAAADRGARTGRGTGTGGGPRAVREWQHARREAGLPPVNGFDGPLVSLAIALLFDRDVPAELERFRRARGATLPPERVELDIELGRRAVASVQRPDPAAVPALVAEAGAPVVDIAVDGRDDGRRSSRRGAGSGLLLAGTLLCRAAAGGMRATRLPRARAGA